MKAINSNSPLIPQLALWGICLFAIGWVALTFWFETHLGWPGTGVQWAKRLVGWAVEFWMIRTLFLGFNRCRAVTTK